MAAIGAAAAAMPAGLGAGLGIAAAAPPGGLASGPFPSTSALPGLSSPAQSGAGFALPTGGSPVERAMHDLEALIILALLAGHHRHGAPMPSDAMLAVLALQAYAGVQALAAGPGAAGAGIHVQA